MKIKFCGIRRLEDVQFCNELQPDYLGMILSAGFRRTVSPETAKQLVNAKRSSIAAVGVFVNETPEQIAEVLKHVPLDVIQLHGSETAEVVSGVRWRTGLPIWKAVRVQRAAEIAAAQQLGADRLILEGHVPGQAGGTGYFFAVEFSQSPRYFSKWRCQKNNGIIGLKAEIIGQKPIQ